jgi:hypothetical protein
MGSKGVRGKSVRNKNNLLAGVTTRGTVLKVSVRKVESHQARTFPYSSWKEAALPTPRVSSFQNGQCTKLWA